MAKVDSVERLITGEKGIWMDLQEKPACCPCIFPPPYFKVFNHQTDSDTSNSHLGDRRTADNNLQSQIFAPRRENSADVEVKHAVRGARAERAPRRYRPGVDTFFSAGYK